MQIKRFEALNMTEALKQVKREFGPDAVILSARTLKKPPRGLFRGLRNRPAVEVTAAIDHPAGEPAYQGQVQTAGGVYQRAPRTGRRLTVPMDKKRTRRGVRPIPKKSKSKAPQSLDAKPSKEMGAARPTPDLRPLFDVHRHLRAVGVGEDVAWDLVKAMDSQTEDAQGFGGVDIQTCLAEAIRTLGGATRRLKLTSGSANVVALVGPTGVGKTTTIAKLAAAARIHGDGGGVAVVSVDQDGIGAQTQMRTYAEIIGIPYAAAMDAESLDDALTRLADHSLILLDTAGINPRREEQVDRLADLLEGCRPNVQIVLGATAKTEDLHDTIYHLRPLGPAGLIFTKLDETATHGAIVEQMIRSRLPVAYFTNGRQVPEDFQTATVEDLVALLDLPAGRPAIQQGPGASRFEAELADFQARLQPAPMDSAGSNPYGDDHTFRSLNRRVGARR